MIEEIINSQKNVLLIPRPRRFGKTLNLSMLRYFFDISIPENIKLFKNLEIWENTEIIKNHCCNYPVIYLTFKDVKANNWEECYELIVSEIVNIYSAHYYLYKENFLKEHEKIKFEKIIKEKASKVEYQKSLKQLSEYLYKYHNKKVVILIDEYDTPIQSGYNKFYDDVVVFLRNLLSGAFKDNSVLYKGVISGILRVSKESIFSGLNNLDVFSIFNYDFSDKFGFTQSETDKILSDFNLSDKKEQVKKWYNGYKFGQNENIYNPWSILNFVTKYKEGFKTFWSNTSSNDLIKNQLKKKDADNIRKDI